MTSRRCVGFLTTSPLECSSTDWPTDLTSPFPPSDRVAQNTRADLPELLDASDRGAGGVVEHAGARSAQSDPEATGLYLDLQGALDSHALTRAIARTIAETPTLSLRFLETS